MDAKDLLENSTSGGVDLKVRDLILQPIKACQPRHKFVTTLQVESSPTARFRIPISTPDLNKRRRQAVHPCRFPWLDFTIYRVRLHGHRLRSSEKNPSNSVIVVT